MHKGVRAELVPGRLIHLHSEEEQSRTNKNAGDNYKSENKDSQNNS